MDKNLKDSRSNWATLINIIVLAAFLWAMVHICSRVDKLYEIQTEKETIK